MATDSSESQDRSASDQSTPQDHEKTPALKRPAVRRGLLIGVIVAIVLAGVWLFHYETTGKFMQETNDAYIQADAVTISPKVSGYVQAVLVSDNQDVQAGQPLVRIDPRDYTAQAQQYRAQIDVAKANADNVRASIGEQDAAIIQARAQLQSAEADARFAEQEASRYAPLAATGAETRERSASLRNDAIKARAAVSAQRAALLAAERRISSLKAQVRQADAQGEAAQAQLDAAHVNVGATTLKASEAGRVGDRTVRVGQFVQAGTRLMTVVPLAKLYVTANFKETQIGLMRPGQRATIKVDALNGTEVSGHVESISPGTGAQFSLLPPENATGNFTKIVQRVPVRIALDAGPDARRVLVPGLSVTVTVDTLSAKGTQSTIADQEKARRDASK